jgi:hypothetical protein
MKEVIADLRHRVFLVEPIPSLADEMIPLNSPVTGVRPPAEPLFPDETKAD